MNRQRCAWSGTDPLYCAYHDEEWGVPVHEDRRLFEMLVLEGAQAGLAWITILRKREAYRKAFEGFDPERVAAYDEQKIQALLQNPGIVRNRLKLGAAVGNAKAFLAVQEAFGSFDHYLWSFLGGQPRINHWTRLAEVPALTPEAERLSKDLKHREFRFVGPTIIYAFMQSVGMVDDHLMTCWKRNRG